MKQERWNKLHKELDDALDSGFELKKPKQSTAVGYLEEVFWGNEGMITSKDLEKAKEMEKEHINDAHYEGSENYRRQYYKETFESGICCPNCNESENIHVNYDYSKEHKPVESYLCNECGAFFTSKLN
jgi:hypothetical protein